jgi:AraC-like DNA-binding protein
MTIGEYIQQYRVAQAQRLLATSEESVLTIALQTGFGSTSSFYATFKKIVGCAPLDYRRTVR